MGETDGPIEMGKMSNVQRAWRRVSDSRLGRNVAYTSHRVADGVERFFNRVAENSTRTRAGSVISFAELLAVTSANIAAEYPQVHGPYRTALDVVAAVSTVDFIIRAYTGHGVESAFEYVGRQAIRLDNWTGKQVDEARAESRRYLEGEGKDEKK